MTLAEMYKSIVMRCYIGNNEAEWQKFKINWFGMMEKNAEILVIEDSSCPTFQVNFDDDSSLTFELSVENCYILFV